MSPAGSLEPEGKPSPSESFGKSRRYDSDYPNVQELLFEVKIGEVMTREVIHVSPQTPMAEIRRLLREHRISGIPVVQDGKLEGIISIEDLINTLAESAMAATVGERMTRNPVTLREDEPVVVAINHFNLARSAREIRRAVAEAARVARPGAGLFVFTFSRATLSPGDQPIPGEAFVFTQFAGEPQCFLTEAELVAELRQARFEKDPPGPITEHTRPVPGRTLTRGGPVIYEGTLRVVRPS